MKKNPGRKEARRLAFKGKPGDLNRKGTHRMKSQMGMKHTLILPE